jgi:hypothetical protein
MAFLQYKTEAIPGKPLKRKVTQEETREWKNQYEKDRERKFIKQLNRGTSESMYDKSTCKLRIARVEIILNQGTS